MPKFKLYFFPGTCARVSMIALEEINIPFETQLLVFMRGEHKSPDYLKINPKGKVPTLLVDDRPLTETIAILNYLHRSYPQAQLLPASSDAFSEAQVQADLSWCASTLHPLVTGVVLPQVYCGHPEGRTQTWVQLNQLIKPHIDIIEQRLAAQPWMLGQQWSVVDAYVFWIWDQIVMGGYEAATYRHLPAHAERSKARPSVQRALQREGEAFGRMAAQGIKFDLPPPPKPGK